MGRVGLAAPADDMDPLMVAFTFPLGDVFDLFGRFNDSAAGIRCP
jgi:hypothetical protein